MRRKLKLEERFVVSRVFDYGNKTFIVSRVFDYGNKTFIIYDLFTYRYYKKCRSTNRLLMDIVADKLNFLVKENRGIETNQEQLAIKLLEEIMV